MFTDLKKEIVSMTVQEKIVGEDFVDMDVSIENIEGTVLGFYF